MTANITEWLDASAARRPEAIAVTDGDGSYTFAEYRAAALSVARAIIERTRARKRPVIVSMPKSARVLFAFAGAAYSGNFYSPIDVEMPDARAEKIISTLDARLAVADRENAERLRRLGFDGDIVIYEDLKSEIDDESVVLPVRDMAAKDDILYVLFTSGSTGVPKGVCIRHRSVIDYVEWLVSEFRITHEDSFANQAAFSFDMSILEIFCTLASGARLFIVPHELFARPIELLGYLRDNRIDSISWVPSALVFVAASRSLQRVEIGHLLKRVFFCGEVMPCKALNVWRRAAPDAEFVNFYGPTEATHSCTYYRIRKDFADDDALPIGHARPNTEILVLDEDDRPIPSTDSGSVGELCVRGSCLAVGYYKDPERTREVFVQDPRSDLCVDKIYRTGDIVRYNDLGELMYVGRKDFQIKRSGYRIELGEIEAAASSLEGVAMACCLYDDAKGRITLFVEGEFEQGAVRRYLSGILPAYMLPNRVICLDRMPLTANGKVDRTALKRC